MMEHDTDEDNDGDRLSVIAADAIKQIQQRGAD